MLLKNLINKYIVTISNSNRGVGIGFGFLILDFFKKNRNYLLCGWGPLFIDLKPVLFPFFIFLLIVILLLLSWFLSVYMRESNNSLNKKILSFFQKSFEKYTYFLIMLILVTFFLLLLFLYIFVLFGISYNGYIFMIKDGVINVNIKNLGDLVLIVLSNYLLYLYIDDLLYCLFLLILIFCIWFKLINEFIEVDKKINFLVIFFVSLFCLFYIYHIFNNYFNLNLFNLVYAMKNEEGHLIESVDLNLLKSAVKVSSQDVDISLVEKVVNSKSGIVYSNNNNQCGVCFDFKEEVQQFYQNRNIHYGIKRGLDWVVIPDESYDVLKNNLNQKRYCVFLKNLK